MFGYSRRDEVQHMLTRSYRPVWGPVGPSIPLDAVRRDDHYEVKFDLPGVDPASIDVTVERNVLTVRAERSWNRQEGDRVVVSERGHGKFVRRLFLNKGLDGDAISAAYNDGVLTVNIPVAEQAQPRKVEITTGEAKTEQAA
jgi:HSP20 family protein